MVERLNEKEVDYRLGRLKGWKREGEFITKSLEFKSFMDGIRFVDEAARVAEQLDHHPDIKIVYTNIKLSLQTHSEGGVTEWDFELAEALDKIAPS